MMFLASITSGHPQVWHFKPMAFAEIPEQADEKTQNMARIFGITPFNYL